MACPWACGEVGGAFHLFVFLKQMMSSVVLQPFKWIISTHDEMPYCTTILSCSWEIPEQLGAHPAGALSATGSLFAAWSIVGRATKTIHICSMIHVLSFLCDFCGSITYTCTVRLWDIGCGSSPCGEHLPSSTVGSKGFSEKELLVTIASPCKPD